MSIDYTITGNFNGGNIFTAQLSDAAGSFSSPVDIGSVSSTTAGTISALIPATTAGGSGYRIRVISSDPVITGTDNGTNLTIKCPPPTNLQSSNITATSAKLLWTGNSCAVSYRLRYRPVGAANYLTATANGTSKTVSGLTANTFYEWSVRTKCVNSPAVWSSYPANLNFTTLNVKLTDNLEISNDFTIFPNPSKGIFDLNIGGTATSVDIYNMVGQLIWHTMEPANDKALQIDLSSQPRGIYFVEVKMEDRVITKRVTLE